MEDGLELGLEAFDKVVDKHFHKLPDNVLHAHTYSPKNMSRSRRRESNVKETSKDPSRKLSKESPGSDSDPDWDADDRSARDRRNVQRSSKGAKYSSIPPPPVYPLSSQYSREPPKLRTQYLPNDYSRSAGHDGEWNDESYYSDHNHRPRRPNIVTRRSSSYHGPRPRRHDGYSFSDDEGSPKSHGQMSRREALKDKSRRYRLKEETVGRFTQSPAGMTGAVAGGLLGAWASSKAQVVIGRDQKKERTRDIAGNKALTLLGAAAGAMAVNAAVSKWQHGRENENRREDEAWAEKWLSGDEDGEKGVGRGRKGSPSSSGRRKSDERRW